MTKERPAPRCGIKGCKYHTLAAYSAKHGRVVETMMRTEFNKIVKENYHPYEIQTLRHKARIL